MTKWREIFGFDGEDLHFETVHWKACKLKLGTGRGAKRIADRRSASG